MKIRLSVFVLMGCLFSQQSLADQSEAAKDQDHCSTRLENMDFMQGFDAKIQQLENYTVTYTEPADQGSEKTVLKGPNDSNSELSLNLISKKDLEP